MKVLATEIREVLLIEPSVFGDGRGYFFESYSSRRYAELGLPEFVQDNVSHSRHGILRGMHLQSPPNTQGKLLSVLDGEIFDVALDARVGSPTFGQHVARVLSSDNKLQLYVPPGFAHGFCVLSEAVTVAFKCTAYYEPSAELTIAYDDPALAIPWPTQAPILVKRDTEGLKLADVPAHRLLAFSA